MTLCKLRDFFFFVFCSSRVLVSALELGKVGNISPKNYIPSRKSSTFNVLQLLIQEKGGSS